MSQNRGGHGVKWPLVVRWISELLESRTASGRPAIGVTGTGFRILRNGQIAEGIDCNGCVAPINPEFDPRFEGRATTAMQKDNTWNFPAGFPHRNSEPGEDAGWLTPVVRPGEKECADAWIR
jgi:hypothetical protein